MRRRALLPLSGIAFVVLTVIGLAVSGSTPAPDAPADEVVSFYRDEENRARAGIWFFAFAMPFLPSSRAASPDSSDPRGKTHVWSGAACLAGAAIMSATLGVAITTQLALADSTEPDSTRGHAGTKRDCRYVVYALLPATGTMMLGAAGWLLGRERVQGWLGWGCARPWHRPLRAIHRCSRTHPFARGSPLRASFCSARPVGQCSPPPPRESASPDEWSLCNVRPRHGSQR